MDRIHDGHTFIFGQDTDTEPSALVSSIASKAVNRSFRGGRNRTRPPFVHRPFIFDEESAPYEETVRFGNVQGGFAYKRKKPGRYDGLVLAIAGHIFHFTIVNDSFRVKMIWTQNDPKLLYCWMEQAEEWLYAQDGSAEAVFWDGLYPSSARRSLGTIGGEMPIGTIMRYIHGRMFVSNAFDQIAASDIMYGAGLTNAANVQKFTENTYWSEGGYFGAPTNLGRITGMIAMPRYTQGNLRAQGELLVMSIDGAQTIEAGVLRSQWKDQQVQSVTLTGRGCVGPWSLVAVNNDAFFRSDDGMATYKMLTQENRTSYAYTKISSPVNYWMDQDTQHLLDYNSAIYFDNRLLMTVSPFLAQPRQEIWGSHRFHRGIVVLDMERAGRNRGDSDFNFDGLWTGIRPTILLDAQINNTKRAFAVSYDTDGENRIYEIMRKGFDDVIDQKTVRTKWHYMTKRFSWIDTKLTNEFEVKRIVGGEVWTSDIHNPITVEAFWRPDNMPCWHEMLPELEFGSKPDGWVFSQPRYKRFKFITPKDVCVKGAPYPANHGAMHQVMIKGEGGVQIDRLRVSVTDRNDPNAPIGSCNEPPNDQQIALDCIDQDDYVYNIADYR